MLRPDPGILAKYGKPFWVLAKGLASGCEMDAPRPNRKAGKSIPEEAGDEKQKITIRVITGKSVRKSPSGASEGQEVLHP
jgi:hypothetical protein